jgi:chemotaxis protein CheD
MMGAHSVYANEVRVGIADLRVVRNPGGSVVTHALGSCIGVFTWDRDAGVGGCLHAMLPRPTDHQVDNPARYVETGLPLLLTEMERLGAVKKRLVVKIAGGAEMNGDHALFRIGARNIAATRQALWAAGLMLAASEVGGNIPRTARLVIATGEVQDRKSVV